MRGLVVWLVAMAVLAVAGPATARAPGGVTDVPGLGGGSPRVDSGGFSPVERNRDATAPGRGRHRDRVDLVGALRLDPFNRQAHGDLYAYGDLAFVGKGRGECPATGVDIIDISRPRAPVKIADTRDYADTSMEDMQVIRIGRRDILAIGLQECGRSATEGTVGLELYDITNPRHPRLLSLFNGEDFGMEAAHGHVHELDLVKRRDGRVLAALAAPNLEVNSADAEGRGGVGDLLLVDITDPRNPRLTGEYGVLDDPMFGMPVYLGVRQGGDARTLDHSARFNRSGTRLYVSYWDAGVIILDVRDPARPVRLGRTAFRQGEEGNAHSVDTADHERTLIQADEDYTPFETRITSSAFADSRPGVEPAFTPQLVRRTGKEITGEVIHVGRGCPADPRPAPPAGTGSGITVDDPYLADPAGKIALIERGGCRYDNKIARAQRAGAIGAIVYNDAAGGEGLLAMSGASPVTDGPEGIAGTQITIPAMFVQRSTGLALIQGTQPATARAFAFFNGWGYLRFFDISDPAHPVQIATFATPNTNNEAVALDGWFTAHNPEVLRKYGDRKETDLLYVSWYADGVRVLNIRNPARPREIASWTGQGAPAGAPPVDIWSVVPHRGLLLASDRNFGLYVLRHRGGD